MDMSKYKFYEYERDGQRVVAAVSTYAGKRVKGIAKCDPADTYDAELGKRLAALRCAEKIARRRLARSKRKYVEAAREFILACSYQEDMNQYHQDAIVALRDIRAELDETLKSM